MIKINYGVYKKGEKPFNGKLEGDFNWDSNEDHKKIRQLIYDKHPGFSIHGYCIAPEQCESKCG